MLSYCRGRVCLEVAVAMGRELLSPLSPPIDRAVAPLVARLDAIELTDPLLIDTDDCWLWLRAEDGLGRVCWLPKWTSAEDCPPP